MTSYELLQAINEFVTGLDKRESLLGYLRAVRPIYEELLQTNEKTLNDNQRSGASIANHVQLAIAELRSDPFSLYEDLAALDSDIDRLTSCLSKAAEPLIVLAEDEDDSSFLKSRLHQFREGYNEFIAHQNIINSLRLIVCAKEFSNELGVVTQVLQWIGNNLQQQIEIPAKYAEFYVIFKSETTFKDIVQKGEAIHRIYEILCRLKGVEVTDYPLQLAKIESGSGFFRFFGYSPVVYWLLSNFDRFFGFFYRNWTKEGNFYNQLDRAREIFEFQKEVDSTKFKSKANKQHLKEAVAELWKKHRELAKSQASVEINGKQHSVTQSLREKYLLESKKKLLTSGEEDSSDNDSNS